MILTTKLPTMGYKFLDNGKDTWTVLAPNKAFTESLKQVCTFAVHELGFSMVEINIGIVEMEKSFHSVAEFGVRKSFMFSYDQEEYDATSTRH